MNRTLTFSFVIGMCLVGTTTVESKILDIETASLEVMQKVPIGSRTIASVKEVMVYTPVGTVPRLPYQVWVTYSDGKSAYRQIRWSNATLATELLQADATNYPVGTHYTINGFILGDDTTDEGYPITAKIEVVSGSYNAPAKPVAQTVPLGQVTITGDNRLTSNRELAIGQILSWDVTQQLYNYRDTYGLSTDGYTRSDGWDSPETKLKGHGSGHYMSALALAYAASTDAGQQKELLQRISRMVNELRECQERTFVWNEELGRYWEARDFAPENELKEMKGTWADFDEHKTKWTSYGYGYLNAIPAHHPALIEMYRAYNNSDWVWAPYYTIHKQLAGLIDIATYVKDKEIAAKALLIAKDMGLWIWNRMHYRTFIEADGTQDERRSRPGNRYEMWDMYIAGEVGGIGESLAILSQLVTNPEEKSRLLEASNSFDGPAFFNPLAKNVDDIRTRHANQHIPMVIAALKSYLGNKNSYYYNLAENFWNLVQSRYRYFTGNVGNGEMFRQPYTQILSMVTNGLAEGDTHANPDINETCCAYNLLKLTKDLNSFNPNDARYMDAYERTLYNQVIGSLHPTEYGVTYQYAVGLNATKPFGNRTPQSTCCGGTGSESHVKYQEAAYFVSVDELWVALYMPTLLEWEEKGITLEQSCLWPAEKSTIKVTSGEAEFAMKLRVPYWATEGFDIKVDGKSIATAYEPCSYAVIPKRTWKEGDVVEITMPFTKHIDYGADKLEVDELNKEGQKLPASWVGTLMYGPLAMAGTGFTNWEEATLNIDSQLATIGVGTPVGIESGMAGNLYTLTQGGHIFQPDYYRNDHSTHYFRINHVSDPTSELKIALSAKLDEATAFAAVDYTKRSYAGLKAAVKESERLLKRGAITEASTSATMRMIDQAMEGLVATGLNKSHWETAVQRVERLDVSLYTSDSYEALQSVIASTRGIIHSTTSQVVLDRETWRLNKAVEDLVLASSVDKGLLRELLHMVQQRKVEQEKWHALDVKVPEFAPWAPFGFTRLERTLIYAMQVESNRDKNYSQVEVNTAVASLNKSINTMRPGNLAEMEDLRPLSALLRRAGTLNESTGVELKEAVAFAQMVMKYVGDGSGTHDMIATAVERMKKATGQ